MQLERPIPLESSHDVDSFSCGNAELDTFLKKYALQSQASQASRTYISLQGEKVMGYYTLTFGSVSSAEAPERVSKGLGRYPIPIIILARLAVEKGFQGRGLGESLLKDAFKRTINASEIAGLRAIVVHAKNEQARRFYKKYGLMESPVDEFHLYLLTKDVLKSIIS